MVGLWTCSTKTPILNTPILWSQCRISLHPPWLQADSLLRGRWGGSGAAEWLRKPSRITIEPKWNGVPISNKLKVDKGISTEKKMHQQNLGSAKPSKIPISNWQISLVREKNHCHVSCRVFHLSTLVFAEIFPTECWEVWGKPFRLICQDAISHWIKHVAYCNHPRADFRD